MASGLAIPSITEEWVSFVSPLSPAISHSDRIPCNAMHGDKNQNQRDAAMNSEYIVVHILSLYCSFVRL